MPVRTLTVALTLLAALGLAACGSPPIEPAPAAAAAGQDTPAPPAPTASPTPTVDPASLQPGTNHSYAAAEYAFEAEDVHDWLTVGETAHNYPPSRIVFLTFDDGPNNRITPRVLDALAASKAPATFFYITGPDGLGNADPAIVHRTIADGHAIDIHSHSHSYGKLFPGRRANAANILADREQAITAIRSVLGEDYAVSGYRYPGGHLSWRGIAAADQALAEQGAYWLDWNAMNGDTEKNAPDYADGQLAMVKATLERSENPNAVVVLMHDHEWADTTVEAIPLIVDYFREEGYEFGVIN